MKTTKVELPHVLLTIQGGESEDIAKFIVNRYLGGETPLPLPDYQAQPANAPAKRQPEAVFNIGEEPLTTPVMSFAASQTRNRSKLVTAAYTESAATTAMRTAIDA